MKTEPRCSKGKPDFTAASGDKERRIHLTGTIQIADFDMQIAEILLVHRNTFIHRFKWTEYRTGRQIDGMTFCVSGIASFDCGDSVFELHPGQAVFLPACSSYVLHCESEEPFIHYTVNFRLNRDGIPADQTAFSEILTGKLWHLTAPDSMGIYQPRFEALLSVWQSKQNGYRVMSKAMIYELLYLYFTDAGREHRNKDEYNRLRPAKKLLDEHYMDSQRIAALAELCGMSETHFRRMFVKLFAVSPSEYRLRKRILRAKDLLLSGQYTISEAAREVGFSDPNYFARIFRLKEGISPSEFMK